MIKALRMFFSAEGTRPWVVVACLVAAGFAEGFGIATLLSHESAPAGGHAFLEGTLAYIAPEQTGLLRRTVDSRADLYSLGATIYEMLTGAPPFDEQDPIDLVHSHAARVPTPPHERRRGLPEILSAIVMNDLPSRLSLATRRSPCCIRCTLPLASNTNPFEPGSIRWSPFPVKPEGFRNSVTSLSPGLYL